MPPCLSSAHAQGGRRRLAHVHESRGPEVLQERIREIRQGQLGHNRHEGTGRRIRRPTDSQRCPHAGNPSLGSRSSPFFLPPFLLRLSNSFSLDRGFVSIGNPSHQYSCANRQSRKTPARRSVRSKGNLFFWSAKGKTIRLFRCGFT